MSATDSLTAPLPVLGCAPNWHPKGPQPAEFVLLGLGPRIDELAETVAAETADAPERGTRAVGTADDLADVPGAARTLRVLETLAGVHHARVDLVLVRRGDDLYVKQELSGRTLLKWLRVVVYGCLFVVLFSGAAAAYVRLTGAHAALVQEYAKKYTGAGPDAAEALQSGWRFDATSQAWVPHRPLSLAEVARADPGLFVQSVGVQATALAGLVGLVLAALPTGFLNACCRLLGWPTAREFDAHARGTAAGVRAALCRVLYHRFGVVEAQKLALA